MQGFIISQYAVKFREETKQLSQWLLEGKLISAETIVRVLKIFHKLPQASIDLFNGQNTGKIIVKI